MWKKLRYCGKITYHWRLSNFWKFHKALDPSWHSYFDFQQAFLFAHSFSNPPKVWNHFHRLWKSHLQYTLCEDSQCQIYLLENNRKLQDIIMPIQAFLRYSKTQKKVRVCVEPLCFLVFSLIRPKCLSWNNSSWPYNHQGKFRPQQIRSEKFLSYLTSYFIVQQKSE